MENINSLVRKTILNLKPYTSARDEMQGSPEVFMDANENPYNNGVNRYPTSDHKDLRALIAEEKGLSAENVILGNGSDGLIDMLVNVFCEPKEDQIVVFPPTFGLFKVRAEVMGVDVCSIPLDENFLIDEYKIEEIVNNPKNKMVFIVSPNNPTGNLMNRMAIYNLLVNFKGVVVIDEAYGDFATEEKSWVEELPNYPNLIVMQTASKARGMAGIRLGWAMARKEIIDFLFKVKHPYNINVLTLEKACEAFEKGGAEFREQVPELVAQRIKVADSLAGMSIVEKVFPSDTNFLLVKFKDGKKVYEHLVEHKIITRGSFPNLDNCLRITLGTPQENEKLLKALQNIT